MTPEELKAACLALPGSVETFPFGEGISVFKVEGRVFALSRLGGEPLQVSLRCEPELAVQLRAAHAAIAPGWHLNKRHWNTVTLDGSLPAEMVRELIEDSYDLVVERLPRAKRIGLRWRGG
ncbi:MmcQ/YjbR family DNA-binding protein [Conexibacter arvalis]|uniref:Putative DNA-binding protein (MmcQ/YjbR family) n=1 Tax=Conexibacter arvalis TaxID=912552 RepID=A0A840IK40_9ACTN|nr:MmcQ/YjbR family DNA-binding protein [Conexibacter arvalis]MBB4665136.1 putative DNA-binding protein (MmcQ/YjbR family) [Conexibacter arvalis]